MPNYVTNRIRFSGEPSRIKELMNKVKDDVLGFGTIDFNKLVPMPKELDIESGSRTDAGMKVYRQFVEQYLFDECNAVDSLKIPETAEAAYLEKHPEIDSREWNLGKAAHRNLLQYGAKTWYEWCIQHWGTKWNAVHMDARSESELKFDTAWNSPEPVLAAMTKAFPDLTIEHLWADEDIGHNCGSTVYHDGMLTEYYTPQDSVMAIRFALAIIDKTAEDFAMTLNATGDRYISTWNDFHPAKIFQMKSLYAPDRLTESDIPKGTYCYHMQENGEGRELVKQAEAGFVGSLITHESIDLGENGTLPLQQGDLYISTGEWMSYDEFLSEQHDEAESQTVQNGGMCI